MKASHLAALCIASIGLGGMSSAAIGGPQLTLTQHHSNKVALPASSQAMEIAMKYDMREGGFPIEMLSISWQKLNQRQIRKNRRRAHAAGKRHAFA
jgi:hypothetical protein